MIVECAACGWRSTNTSKIQADDEFRKHRTLDCPNLRQCSICAEVAPGKLQSLDADEPPVFVCDRCDTEHPRQGGYSYDGSSSRSRVDSGRKGIRKG